MPPDLYMRIVLTVIAVSLSIIAFRGTLPGPAIAYGEPCGAKYNPCYVMGRVSAEIEAGSMGTPVMIMNWASMPRRDER